MEVAMDQSRIITEIAGQGAIGLAILEEGATRRQGLFVKHRLDGSLGLAFDMFVRDQQPISLKNFQWHPRRQSVEFLLSEGIGWPDGVGVLMSRGTWEKQRQRMRPLGSAVWPTFDDISQAGAPIETSYWGGCHIDVTGILLGSPTYPVAYAGYGQWRFDAHLGLIDCEDDVCLVSQSQLKRSGSVFLTERGTCFFPSDRVLRNSVLPNC
jgi:hypothetical protein